MDWLVELSMVGAGLVLLAFAADRFVLAAARLSRLWGLSPILVGALVVGMGTSAPELLVSLLAARAGELDLAIGNAVGSNVSNVTLVLGVTAMLAPLTGNLAVLRREGLLMFAAVSALAVVLWDLRITRTEGAALAGGMVIAALLVVRWAHGDDRAAVVPAEPGEAKEEVRWPKELTFGLLSLGFTLLGAELLVQGGVHLAMRFGVGSAFIGLTLVAVGTSLPELATSIAGVRRNEHDMVIGNVLGSNLFNALAVAGTAGLLAPGPTDSGFRNASMMMVGCAALAGFLALTGKKLVRWEGALLFAGFVAFVYLTFLQQ